MVQIEKISITVRRMQHVKGWSFLKTVDHLNDGVPRPFCTFSYVRGWDLAKVLCTRTDFMDGSLVKTDLSDKYFFYKKCTHISKKIYPPFGKFIRQFFIYAHTENHNKFIIISRHFPVETQLNS